MTAFESSTVISLNGRLRRMPALLTRTEGSPRSAVTRLTASWTSPWTETSVRRCKRGSPGGLDVVHGRLGSKLRDIEHRDGHPVGGKPARGGGTDTARRAGHDGDVIGLFRHVTSSSGRVLRVAEPEPVVGGSGADGKDGYSERDQND